MCEILPQIPHDTGQFFAIHFPGAYLFVHSSLNDLHRFETLLASSHTLKTKMRDKLNFAEIQILGFWRGFVFPISDSYTQHKVACKFIWFSTGCPEADLGYVKQLCKRSKIALLSYAVV